MGRPFFFRVRPAAQHRDTSRKTASATTPGGSCGRQSRPLEAPALTASLPSWPGSRYSATASSSTRHTPQLLPTSTSSVPDTVM
eukprot:289650-Chlamydomonas_euryale.AAC.1